MIRQNAASSFMVLAVLVFSCSETVGLFGQDSDPVSRIELSKHESTGKSNVWRDGGVVSREFSDLRPEQNATELLQAPPELKQPLAISLLGGNGVSVSSDQEGNNGTNNYASESSDKVSGDLAHTLWEVLLLVVQGAVGGLIGSLLVAAAMGNLHHIIPGAKIVCGELRERLRIGRTSEFRNGQAEKPAEEAKPQTKTEEPNHEK